MTVAAGFCWRKQPKLIMWKKSHSGQYNVENTNIWNRFSHVHPPLESPLSGQAGFHRSTACRHLQTGWCLPRTETGGKTGVVLYRYRGTETFHLAQNMNACNAELCMSQFVCLHTLAKTIPKKTSAIVRFSRSPKPYYLLWIHVKITKSMTDVILPMYIYNHTKLNSIRSKLTKKMAFQFDTSVLQYIAVTVTICQRH